MREILFRGKRTDTGEWVEGTYIQIDDSDNFCYIFEPYNLASSLPPLDLVKLRAKKVIPETVGQFTGVIDNNGKKMFEGDIIKCTFIHDLFGAVLRFEPKIEAIVYREGNFNPLYNCERKSFEVIGNIHDNPELLK